MCRIQRACGTFARFFDWQSRTPFEEAGRVDPPHPPGKSDECENKRLGEIAIRKVMKTKGAQRAEVVTEWHGSQLRRTSQTRHSEVGAGKGEYGTCWRRMARIRGAANGLKSGDHGPF
jgi:hypothetical protein